MNGRPDFRDIKSFEEFSRYYWYIEELSKICKSLGLEYRSTKQDLTHIIEQYFNGNRIEKSQRFVNKNQTEVPKAKRFKRWVTSEVLPSIRKHGGYIQHQEELSEEEIFVNAVLLANKLIAEKNKEVERLKPKAEYYDKLVDQHLLTNFRNTAKELHLTQKRFIQFLMEHQFIYRDKKNRLLPYAKKNKGYFEIKEWVREEGQVVGIQTLITPKGREFFLFLVGGDDQFD